MGVVIRQSLCVTSLVDQRGRGRYEIIVAHVYIYGVLGSCRLIVRYVSSTLKLVGHTGER